MSVFPVAGTDEKGAKMGLISNLGELTFNRASDNSPSGAGLPARAAQVPTASPVDEVHLATIPFTTQAEEQLQEKNPPNLQEVLGVAVRNLKAAAVQSSDPVEAAYLSGLADRLEQLQEVGGQNAAPYPAASSRAAGA